VRVDEQSRRLTAAVTDGPSALGHVLQRLAEKNLSVVDVGLRRPTLDDVFLSLTGHAAEEEEETPDESAEKPEGERDDVREKEAVR
jgi:ABC-2 type transport system ATP-binding protein